MKVCLGGTFDIIHEGHEKLLEKAFEIGEDVVIGLSSDGLVKKFGKVAEKYEKRKRNLEKFLEKKGWKAKIEKLDDEYGTTISENFDAIVVSPETKKNAEIINNIRRKKGLKPIKIICISYELSNDGIPISTSRIKNGEIRKGKRLIPLKVCIGSKNKIKIDAVKEIFDDIFSNMKIEYYKIEVKTEKQPSGEKIMEGALKRALNAVKGNDYGIGIEAGLKNEYGINFIEHYAVVADKTGYITYGKSPSFQCPEWVIEEIKKGKEIKEILSFEEKGLIWHLSNKIERSELIKNAILMALIPRIKNKP
ncbi:MAG TPA: DUF84 family protein [Thermoplasmatales archaeon]|nr:DUF84 family protein [Thermoplasmatales archaeon]